MKPTCNLHFQDQIARLCTLKTCFITVGFLQCLSCTLHDPLPYECSHFLYSIKSEDLCMQLQVLLSIMHGMHFALYSSLCTCGMYIMVHFWSESPYTRDLGILRSSSSTMCVNRSGRPWYMCFRLSSSSQMPWLMRNPSSAWSLSMTSEMRLAAAWTSQISESLVARSILCVQ